VKEKFYLSDTYILFAQWENKISDDFIRLAAEFKSFGITLVPVKLQELDHFLNRRQVPVIILTKTIKQYQTFQALRKKHIDFYLKTKKIRLFHLNSFGEIDVYRPLKQKGHYVSLNLPCKFRDVAIRVLSEYIENNIEDKRWPGGRRAKLPQMGGE